MLKNRQNNNGFTLVELVVSIAILAFIIIAISGVMSSNNLIFRKTKADIDIQDIAQDVESKVTNDVMQAKYIYIEGYTSSAPITFDPNDPGKNLGAGSPTITPVSLLNYSDIYLMDSSDYANLGDSDFLIYTDAQLQAIRDSLDYTSIASGEVHSEGDKFELYFNKVRNMSRVSGSEKDQYQDFLEYVSDTSEGNSGGPYSGFADDALKITGGATKYELTEIYITRIVMCFQVPTDSRYYSGSADHDWCRVVYTFDENKLNVDVHYDLMTGLNTNDTYTDCLNYVEVDTSAGGVSSSEKITGFVGRIDSSNNAIQLDMSFLKNRMRYNAETVIQFRNSYVVEDAK